MPKITVSIPDHDWEFFEQYARAKGVSTRELARRTLARCAEGARRESWEVNARDSFFASLNDLVEEKRG